MTDRLRLDQLTDDMLDQLYRRIDTLEAVCDSNKQAYIGAVKSAMAADERAEKAEAALAAFRDRIEAITDEARGGIRQQLGDALVDLGLVTWRREGAFDQHDDYRTT